MVECHTLGPLRVYFDGRCPPPDLVWRKNIGLLIYLARSPLGSFSRDHLVSTFWGHKPTRDGRHSLREALRVVRRCLGTDRVRADAKHVRLAESALRFDLTPFEEFSHAERWDQATRLVRGDFLEGFRIGNAPIFAEWLERERRQWRERILEAVIRRATPLLDAGRADEAGPVVAKAVRIAPEAEDVLSLAVRCFTLLEARDGVARTRGSFHAYLKQIGVDPRGLPTGTFDRLRRHVATPS